MQVPLLPKEIPWLKTTAPADLGQNRVDGPPIAHATRMRFLLIAAICVWPIRAGDEPSPQSSLLRQEFGPATYARAGVSTVLGEITASPEEWGRGPEGIAKKFASAYGKHLVSTTVRYGVAELLNEDLRYFPAQEKGFGGRLRHSLMSTVIARDATTGDSTPAIGRLAGAFAGGFVSRQWLPDRYHTVASGVASSSLSLGVDAGINVFKEFWLKRRHSKDNTSGLR